MLRNLQIVKRPQSYHRAHGTVATASRIATEMRSQLDRLLPGLHGTHGQARSLRSGPHRFEDLVGFLALDPDAEYAARRSAEQKDIEGRLAGCAPADAFPGEMEGYRSEAALRFADTLQWIAELSSGANGALAKRSLLETGSNPYFLTTLIRERIPALNHIGINYFGNPAEVGAIQTQAITDPRGRLSESTYLYADVERHSLERLGKVEICLFCEVLEHLPFDPAWALFNLASRLRPGGHMILSTPNPARLDNIQRLVFHSGSKDDPISGYGIHGRHNREYTLAELRELLSGSGLTVLRWRTLDVAPTQWSRSSEEHGYGQYILVDAQLNDEPRVYRPPWLYRSFPPQVLRSRDSLLNDPGATSHISSSSLLINGALPSAVGPT